jgi:hypothetical protein
MCCCVIGFGNAICCTTYRQCNLRCLSTAVLSISNMQTPTVTMDYSCVPCDRYFGSKVALEQHQTDSPVHKQSFHCKTCDCYFGSGKALQSHRRDCQAHQESLKHIANVSLHPRRDKAALGPTWTKFPAPDMTTLILEHYARIFASTNPVTVTALPKVATDRILLPIQETREFFMYPEHHQSIAEAVSPEMSSAWFNDDEKDDNFNNEYRTYVMGKFRCNSGICKERLWDSGKVYIEIRGYNGNGYSATVYNQKCKCCGRLGTLALNRESYIDRVTYRLKRWAGVKVTRLYYRGKRTPQHEQDFCEGCKRGKCERGTVVNPYERIF